MEITLALNLPRDEMSVPVARRIVDTSLRTVGVEGACVDDVTLALTEACTNVLKHSGPGDEYEVRVKLADSLCSIEVCDIGRGFDFATLAEGEAATDAERGRGVQLMKLLVDRVRFQVEATGRQRRAPGEAAGVRRRLAARPRRRRVDVATRAASPARAVCPPSPARPHALASARPAGRPAPA